MWLRRIEEASPYAARPSVATRRPPAFPYRAPQRIKPKPAISAPEVSTELDRPTAATDAEVSTDLAAVKPLLKNMASRRSEISCGGTQPVGWPGSPPRPGRRRPFVRTNL